MAALPLEAAVEVKSGKRSACDPKRTSERLLKEKLKDNLFSNLFSLFFGAFKEKLKDNLFSNLFSLFFGAFLAALLFFLTSHPTDPERIKQELLDISLSEMRVIYGTSITESNIEKQFATELEVGADKSIVLVGSTKIDKTSYRWIAIFEKESPSAIDTMVGRSGFFNLSSLTSFEVPSFNSFLVDKIEARDFDEDGTLELHVRIKSIWADSISVGPLILSKKGASNWHLYSLPSISKVINSPADTPSNKWEAIVYRPYHFFGMVGDDPNPKSRNDLKQLALSEDSWILNHNGQEQSFSTLRNGGDYIFRKHVIRGHSQIQTLSFFVDGHAVLGPHYAVVNMFKFGKNGIETDALWNWGHPMYSGRPLRLLEIDLDSISKAGIDAHTIGDVFYGYTEFEKIRVNE